MAGIEVVYYLMSIGVVFFLLYCFIDRKEKEHWNNGRCQSHESPWRHFDMDSASCHGWICSGQTQRMACCHLWTNKRYEEVSDEDIQTVQLY